jgi:hypothetical protein
MLRVFDVLVLLAVAWVLGAGWVAIKFRSAAPKSLFILLFMFVAGSLILGWGDLLVRAPAHVVIDGRTVSGARVYRGWKGETAVMLPGQDEPFVYAPALSDVVYCDATLFHSYWIVGRLENADACMRSVKEEIPLELRANRNELSFNVPQAYKPQGKIERVRVRR